MCLSPCKMEIGRGREFHVKGCFQSVRKMLGCGAGRVESLCFLSCTLGIGKGLCPHFGSHEMIGQILQMRIECCVIHLLYGLSKRPMQCLALSPQQLLIDSMAGE